MAQFVREAIKSDPAIATKALSKQFEQLISQPLSRAQCGSEDPPTVAIIVDALDECDGDDDIKRIIYLFSQARTLSSVRLRVFITSRPELPLRLGFKDIKGKYQDVLLHQIPEPVIEHDISAFLRYELARIGDDYNSQAFDDVQLPPNWPSEPVIQTLVRMAIPLFIFAATVCRFVEDQAWMDPAGQLAKILSYQRSGGSELDKLDTTYLPVLTQLVVGKKGSTRSRLVSQFRDIVGPIVLLAEPLSALSLSQVLDIPAASINGTLSRLHAVLDVPSKTDSPIRPFHLSFRDFLIDPAKRYTNEFWIDERETHQRLATNCLRLMESCLKKNICNLKMPGTPRIEVDSKDLDTFLPAHIQYACRYWVSHLEQGTDRIRDLCDANDQSSESKKVLGDEEIVWKFLKDHFLHWLESLSLLGKLSDGVTSIRKLLHVVQVCL
jgi:hypothetical protein